MRTITLDIPDSLPVSDFEARMLFAAKLYERGYLSAGRCAALVGMEKWEFVFKLGEYGTPYLLPTWEDWQAEKTTLNADANHYRRHELPDSTDPDSAA